MSRRRYWRASQLADNQISKSLVNKHAERITKGHGVSLAGTSRVWARVAAPSFGGPAGQIAVMHRIIVDELRWGPESLFNML